MEDFAIKKHFHGNQNQQITNQQISMESKYAWESIDSIDLMDGINGHHKIKH